MNDVLEFLKNYIWKNGFDALSDNPFTVYKAMKGIEPRTARLVLITLMSKTHELARKECSEEELIDYIQSEHFVNKKTAKDLAGLYLALFSDENTKMWDEAEENGFDAFCQEEWTVEWAGSCDWQRYPCNAEATLVFTVGDREKLHSHLSKELRSNPFLSEDDIYGILSEEIQTDLDNDMEEYCNADDYYEPYLEEFVGEGTFDSEKKWKSWGLEIVEFTGSGDVDYEL